MSSRDRSIIAALVVVIFAVGGYFLVVAPKRHKASQLQGQITTAQQTLSGAEQQVHTGLAAEAQYKVYAKQLSALTAAVPVDAQIPALINQLQAAADKSGTGFQEVSLGGGSAAAATATTASSAAGASFPSQSFSLQFTGSYFSVADLLGRLAGYVQADNRKFHASGRLLTISSVAFAPGTGGFPKVSASVTAIDYDIPSGLGSTSTGAGATS